MVAGFPGDSLIGLNVSPNIATQVPAIEERAAPFIYTLLGTSREETLQ